MRKLCLKVLSSIKIMIFGMHMAEIERRRQNKCETINEF